MSVAKVMKMVKDNDIKFVDFRFTDTRGKEQHVTVPVSHFDEAKFTARIGKTKIDKFNVIIFYHFHYFSH